MTRFLSLLNLRLFLALLLTAAVPVSGEELSCQIRSSAVVDASGVFLDQLATCSVRVPRVRVAASPAAGQSITFSRAQVQELVRQHAPELAAATWSGPAQVRVSRRMRPLDESEVRLLLTSVLQRDVVRDKGELELRFTRPWTTLPVADEVLTLRVLDLPNAGVTPNFIARFELLAGDERVGTWQVPVQARVWREVWVAAGALQRGQLVRPEDAVLERRDVLVLRDLPARLDLGQPMLEFAENLAAGAVLTGRSLRTRPMIRRGKLAEAVVQDGGMTISVRVEVLEDGVHGQTVRVRNIKSKREFRGKVHSEETILVLL